MRHTHWLSLMILFCSAGMAGEEKKLTMWLTLPKSPLALSPFTYLSLNEWYVHFNITAKLVTLDGNNQIASEIARTWRVENGGKTFKMQLRTDRLWSDGTPITPEDIVSSLTHEARHKSSKYLPKILKRGPAEKAIYLEGKNTLVFELHSADDKFLYHLARPEFGVLDARSFKNSDTFTVHTRTSGDYLIAEINDKKIVLVPNPYAKQVLTDNPQKVIFNVVSSNSALLELVRAGKIDFFEIQSEDIYHAAERSGLYQIVDGGMDNLATIQSRMVDARQLKAMQVLNQFLDRSLFAKGQKRAVERLVMVSEVPLEHRRRQILVKEAKHQLGNQKVTMNLTLSDEATSDQKDDAVQIRIEAAKIGIEILISQAKRGFRDKWENEDYELTMARMGVYAYDEIELLNGYFCEGFKPYRSFRGLLCDKIRKATQPGVTAEERQVLLKEAYNSLNDSGRIIGLYHFPRRFGVLKKWNLVNYNNLLPFPIFTCFHEKRGN